jgi:NADPH-dependent 2,4-dienoyl-CoA reductase/sulfur reductase-like enzyme
MNRIVIVGAGVAGLRAAERLRQLGFAGEVLIVGDEHNRPYHRPPLSKDILSGKQTLRDITLSTYEPLNVRWRNGVSAQRLDPARHILTLTGDEDIRYDGLIVATGTIARRPAGIPWHDPRIHVLRTIQDAARLRHHLSVWRGRVVVVGSGFTACETAATVRKLGYDTVLLCRSTPPLRNVVGDMVAERVTELHRANGVRVKIGVEVQDWRSRRDHLDLSLTDGTRLTATTVLVAAGSVPAVNWLRYSGLTITDGIICKPTCHAVGVTDIVAAGDVAAWPNLRFGSQPRRIEHWLNALEMGRAAAESLLAGPAVARPFQPMPRFWSEQFGVRLQAVGMLSAEATAIGVHAPIHRAGSVMYVDDGRLTGALSWNDSHGFLDITADLERQHPAWWPTATTPKAPAAIARPIEASNVLGSG